MNPLEHPHVHRLQHRGREILLVGTAHVSRESAELVEQVLAEAKPDTVCVELCQPRYDALKQKDKWQETDIVRVIREKRTSLLLSQLLLASFQKKIAQRFNIQPGEEMIRAIAMAEEVGARVVLADREVRITLTRIWRSIGFWKKANLLTEVLASLFYTEDITEEEIEKLKERDMLEVALQAIGEKLPQVKTILIDERDRYLASRIRDAEGERIVAVVGAGHVPGIMKNIDQPVDLAELERIPPKGRLALWAGWLFPLAILALFVGGFFMSGARTSLTMILWWSGITAACASAGALLMLSHPLTILASALSAPIATLHPLIATGWVAGLVEATLRKPQVRDFLDLKDDITSFRGFFRNKITRLLILVAVVNLTTSVGTFVAIPVVMKFIFQPL
ncbi:MAG: TraB family protein [Deltaproteobacteria bacterium HGW-Deltaproteobacteria-19]|jgi:pheromone shutdown-related protein TraB|nr:MAG: TraB family protein [Deltaproteobacteria bacterium HGW-Deltaproteobacteria-19]